MGVSIGKKSAQEVDKVDPILAGAAAGAVVEGAKFLYQQAGEILSAWRAKRRGQAAALPKALPAPQGITVGRADPLPEAPSDQVLDTLQELKDLVEPIKFWNQRRFLTRFPKESQ
jgi:hypothetical protein